MPRDLPSISAAVSITESRSGGLLKGLPGFCVSAACLLLAASIPHTPSLYNYCYSEITLAFLTGHHNLGTERPGVIRFPQAGKGPLFALSTSGWHLYRENGPSGQNRPFSSLPPNLPGADRRISNPLFQ